MSYKTKLKAYQEALRVKKLLKNPKGWRVHVWKNLYWYAVLKKGGMNLHWHHDGLHNKPHHFWTLFDNEGGYSGNMFWSPNHKTFRTPDNAVDYQLRIAKTFIRKCSSAVETVEAR